MKVKFKKIYIILVIILILLVISQGQVVGHSTEHSFGGTDKSEITQTSCKSAEDAKSHWIDLNVNHLVFTENESYFEINIKVNCLGVEPRGFFPWINC